MPDPETTAPRIGQSSVTALLVLVFCCELGMLGGLAVVGAALGSGVLASIAFGVAFPALAAALWAMFLAPRAARRLPRLPRLVVKLLLFTGTGCALFAVGYPIAAIGFAVVAGANVIAANVTSDLA